MSSKVENGIVTYYPNDDAAQSPFYDWKFDAVVFSDVKRAYVGGQGKAPRKIKFKDYIFEGAIMPPLEKNKFKGLPIPAQVANELGLSSYVNEEWDFGFDHLRFNKTLFLFPHKTGRNEEMGFEYPIIQTKEVGKTATKPLMKFRNIYIWPEIIGVRDDGYLENRMFAKIPEIFLKLYGTSQRIVHEESLDADCPVYLLYYDQMGNLIYRLVNYSSDIEHDKHFWDSFARR